uniref:Transmembrane BAX inhibitor motif containing 6 n=1 Tax=Myotis myotis TaxID=51298 RepID=A0A7J7Z9A8_MYOMY|nr:transmembrane BAX inhibitor motif containing 6 [Myotis myotis]
MNIFDRKINFDALLKFSHITPSTQQHLKKVYASFALCMFVAAAGAYVHVVTHFIQGLAWALLWSFALPSTPGILMSAMSLMLLSSLGNLFFGSVWLFQANLYLGLMVMCGFVLFDTQLIIEKAENGDKDYIWHCVDLFLDFVTLFRKLMMILAMNEKDKKKEKK